MEISGFSTSPYGAYYDPDRQGGGGAMSMQQAQQMVMANYRSLQDEAAKRAQAAAGFQSLWDAAGAQNAAASQQSSGKPNSQYGLEYTNPYGFVSTGREQYNVPIYDPNMSNPYGGTNSTGGWVFPSDAYETIPAEGRHADIQNYPTSYQYGNQLVSDMLGRNYSGPTVPNTSGPLWGDLSTAEKQTALSPYQSAVVYANNPQGAYETALNSIFGAPKTGWRTATPW